VLPDDPQTRRQEAAVQQVVSESLQRDRLQQMERDMVRDLNREKRSGRLTRLAVCPGILPD
jgi:predicted secreted Zn-dependent protease